MFFWLVPVVLSMVVLAAHFLRSGNLMLTILCLALPFLLLVRRRWGVRIIQAALIIGAAEWLLTLANLVSFRMRQGQPALRMTVILGFVAAVTALSSLVFRNARLREWYGMADVEPTTRED